MEVKKTNNRDHKKQSGFLITLLVITTLIISILTVVSGWVSVFNPAKYWFFAITGLGFPVFFLMNLVMLFIWFIPGKRMAWVPLAATLLTVVKIPSVLQIGGEHEKPDFIEGQSPEFKVMSYNVRLFDLYNWTKNAETRDKIMSFFNENQPSILCLQEFYSSDRHNFDNVKALRESLKASEFHLEYPITLHKSDHWGIATISTFPIIKKGVLYFDKKTANICIFTDVLIMTDTIRVYNCHLQSIRFGAEEYKFLQNLGQDEEEETVKRTRTILSRLRTAFVKRAAQADMISDHIKNCPYPVIVCGDFNDTPLSYAYKHISAGLADAFRESGHGFGSTYAGPIPGLRIDYILHSPSFTAYDFKITRTKMSDHFPVEANMILRPIK